MGANLKEVRDRMKSVQNTVQITKAMKMVSASKLRRAQDAITRLRPYADKLSEILSNLAANVDSETVSALSEEREVKNVLMVLVTSNKGLCGAFNSNLIKTAIRKMNTDYKDQLEQGNVKMVFVGKKGYEYFKNRFPSLEKVKDYITLIEDLSFDETSGIGNLMIQRFLEGRYDRIDVIYAEFQNAVTQNFVVDQYLPIPEKMEEEEAETTSTTANYIFEPDEEEVLDNLVPAILQTKLYKYMLDTNASEHGARMTAMEQATDNANELLKELRIDYNKARQEAITRELSEIVGGAAALEG